MRGAQNKCPRNRLFLFLFLFLFGRLILIFGGWEPRSPRKRSLVHHALGTFVASALHSSSRGAMPRLCSLLLFMISGVHVHKVAPMHRPQLPPRPPRATFTRSQVLAAAAAAAAFTPKSAEASFGSARGAVTSPPKVQNLDLLKLEGLDPKK